MFTPCLSGSPYLPRLALTAAMKHLSVAAAISCLAITSAAAADSESNTRRYVSTAINGARGFVVQRASEELAKVALNQIGLGKVSDFLFPSPETIDYDKIAEIANNAARSANIEQTVSEQRGLLRGSISYLSSAVVMASLQSLDDQEQKLSGIMGVLSEPMFKDQGIGTYVLAANTRLGALTVLYRTDTQRMREHKDQILRVINDAILHVQPYADNVVEKRYGALRCNKSGEWNITDPLHNITDSLHQVYLGNGFERGIDCDHAKFAILDMLREVEFSRKDSTVFRDDHGKSPTMCRDWKNHEWYIFVRGRQPKTKRCRTYSDTTGRFCAHALDLEIEGRIFVPITDAHPIGTGNRCASEARLFLQTAKAIWEDAQSKRAWYEGVIKGWEDLRIALRK